MVDLEDVTLAAERAIRLVELDRTRGRRRICGRRRSGHSLQQALAWTGSDIDPAEIVRSKSGVDTGFARAVAILLCRDVGGMPLLDIARAFGLSRGGSAATIASRARERVGSDPELLEKLVRIRERLRAPAPEVDG